MAGVLLVSPQPLSGKTTIAAGLARRFAAAGTPFALARSGTDANAGPDAEVFASLGGQSGALQITEAPAGDIGEALAADGSGRVVIVATTPDAAVEGAKAAGKRLAGVILNRVPKRRLEAVRAACDAGGVKVLAVVAEDLVLAAPTLGQISVALAAEATNLEAARDKVIGRPQIASIAADPGQSQFTHYAPDAVIVRSDKPDLQLASLNAGTQCLIVTGGLPVLHYVLERVAEEEVPVLRTKLDTLETMQAIEALFGALPFSGERQKLDTISGLLADVDLAALSGERRD